LKGVAPDSEPGPVRTRLCGAHPSGRAGHSPHTYPSGALFETRSPQAATRRTRQAWQEFTVRPSAVLSQRMMTNHRSSCQLMLALQHAEEIQVEAGRAAGVGQPDHAAVLADGLDLAAVRS